MHVVVHADASREIGAGHVIRSLALASALRDLGAEVTLASDELLDGLRRRAIALGVAVVPREDAPRRPDWIVADGYHLDRARRDALAERAVPRLVVDDLGGDVADAALALNQNLGVGPHVVAAGVELLAGPGYSLLAPEYATAQPTRAQPRRVERVLVTMGGADPNDATALAVEALRRAVAPAPQVRVILGPGHPSTERVERAARAAGFDVERNVASLAPHLAWADMVVSGCGTSVLECARLGRPLVGIVLADNQRGVARALAREGLGVVAGPHPGLTEDELGALVTTLAEDEATRTTMAAIGPGLVDGGGASRVARAMASGPMTLRDAALEDADRLLAWRNDPDARRASLHRGTIEPEEHLGWLRERLADPRHRIWIGLLGDAPVGVVRFALGDEVATISVALAADRRGAGLGSRLIAAGCARLAATGEARTVEALIRPDNEPSLAAFRVAGFRPDTTSSVRPDALVLRLALAPME